MDKNPANLHRKYFSRLFKMSRNDLNNFLHAAEHSLSLREAIDNCNENAKKILQVAKEYGFNITLNDLQEDSRAEEINKWFTSSKINPLRKL